MPTAHARLPAQTRHARRQRRHVCRGLGHYAVRGRGRQPVGCLHGRRPGDGGQRGRRRRVCRKRHPRAARLRQRRLEPLHERHGRPRGAADGRVQLDAGGLCVQGARRALRDAVHPVPRVRGGLLAQREPVGRLLPLPQPGEGGGGGAACAWERLPPVVAAAKAGPWQRSRLSQVYMRAHARQRPARARPRRSQLGKAWFNTSKAPAKSFYGSRASPTGLPEDLWTTYWEMERDFARGTDDTGQPVEPAQFYRLQPAFQAAQSGAGEGHGVRGRAGCAGCMQGHVLQGAAAHIGAHARSGQIQLHMLHLSRHALESTTRDNAPPLKRSQHDIPSDARVLEAQFRRRKEAIRSRAQVIWS